MDAKLCWLFLCVNIVLTALVNGRKKHGHMGHGKKHHEEQKAFMKCINTRSTDPNSTENCLAHHNHMIPVYKIPVPDELANFKCCYAELKKCVQTGSPTCEGEMVKCAKNNTHPMVYVKKIPPVLAEVLIERQKCRLNMTRKATCHAKQFMINAEYALLQLCAYELIHCKENNIDDPTCKQNWGTCLNAAKCSKQILYSPSLMKIIQKCSNLGTSDGILTCLLNERDRKLPGKHCRQKVCYEKANATPANFGAIYNKCMAVKTT